MLQSIFSTDFDFDRLLSFASGSISAAAHPPDSKSSDSGLPPDDCCTGDDSPEQSDAPQGSHPHQRQLELRLIIRGDPRGGNGGNGGDGGCFVGSDLVILTSRSEEPIRADLDIRTAHIILNYMEEYLADKEKLRQEWEELASVDLDPSQMSVGAELQNRTKNRYPDCLPYDRTRVHLRLPVAAEIEAHDTYINASHIRDSQPLRRVSGCGGGGYILTQGPLESTVGDFWRLVWQSGASAIVNLTRMTPAATGDDRGSLCAQYWPKRGSQAYGDFEVHLVSEHVWCDEFVIRNLRLKSCCRGGDCSASGQSGRTVTQFNYVAWDECGVPASTASLLEFRRKVNKSYKSRNTPIVVHCSDGCGRSGAYCLLDTALNRITAGVKEVSLAATLEHLRDQRPRLVESIEQFEFVFTAVAEEVDALLRSLH